MPKISLDKNIAYNGKLLSIYFDILYQKWQANCIDQINFKLLCRWAKIRSRTVS